MRPLSDLEGCVLGHLWKYGPSTAYAVRKELLASPSSHWSGSAGAIYPLLLRLEERGIVASRRGAHGDRQHWSYALTAPGHDAFLAWLSPPFDPDLISIAPDPLRTRMYFLGALSPRRRATFLARASEQLERYLKVVAQLPQSDEFDRLAVRGALRLTRARIAWLADVRRSLARTKAGRKRGGRVLTRRREP
jgi:DNA-binding PadR family transcriptional regulator